MLAAYLLSAMAAVSHAWLVQPPEAIEARAGPWRTNIQRRDNPPARGWETPNGTLPDGKSTKTYCPKYDPNNGGDLTTPIDNETLAIPMYAALDWGDTNPVMQNTVGNGKLGQVFNVTLPDGKVQGPYVQICSGTYPGEPLFAPTRDILEHMFDEIACGQKDSIYQGYGTIVDAGQTVPEKYYVWYGPNAPQPCMSAEKFNQGPWEDNAQYYKTPPPSGTGTDTGTIT